MEVFAKHKRDGSASLAPLSFKNFKHMASWSCHVPNINKYISDSYHWICYKFILFQKKKEKEKTVIANL